MRNSIIYALSLLVIAGGFSACKRVQSVKKMKTEKITTTYKDGTVEVKTYRLVPDSVQPQQKVKAKKEKKAKEPKAVKPKRLWDCQAWSLLRDELKQQEAKRFTAKVRIGYYECNDYAERLQLMKLAANRVISLKCDEIVTASGPTYWVTVKLTPYGWWLRESPRKPKYPEDRITEEEAKAFLIPKVDQDQWGVPTYDTVVPVQIKEAMKTFYGRLQAGQSYNQSLVDAKMVCAMNLLNTLASYGRDKLGVNPFTRGMQLTPEMVENIRVLRMPRLQNAYLVSVGENDFIYVIDGDVNVNVVIEDLAYLAPKDLTSYSQTVCSLAGKLTKREILQAREEKRLRDEQEAKIREAMARMQQSEPAKDEDDFEMCETSGSLMPVVHDDPTMYALAKKAEHFEDVELFAGVLRIVKIEDKKVSGDKKMAAATALVTYKLSRVNAVGRIYLGLEDGAKEERSVNFIYNKKDGWAIGGPGAAAMAPKGECGKCHHHAEEVAPAPCHRPMMEEMEMDFDDEDVDI